MDICSYLVDDFHSESGQAGVETSGHGEEANEEKLRGIMSEKKKEKDFKKGQLERLIMTPNVGTLFRRKMSQNRSEYCKKKCYSV